MLHLGTIVLSAFSGIIEIGKSFVRGGVSSRLNENRRTIHLSEQGEDRTMSLISLIVTLVVAGVILWLVNTYIPMDAKIKSILNVVAILVVGIWLLQSFGIIGDLNGIRIR